VTEEIELRFTHLDAQPIAAWLDENFPPRDGDDWRTLELTDRYFDTADLALTRAGYSARLRTTGTDTTLTVKAKIEISDGLHRRLELEAPATRDLDIEAWPGSDARDRLTAVVGSQRLIESFVIGQERRERLVTAHGCEAVASLDEGEVEYLGMPAGELRHFEVELRSGDVSGLRALAHRVVAAGLAVPVDHSKPEIAWENVQAAARVAPDDEWSNAARKLLRRHLVRMLEREAATRAGDVLALKQMRVATRRMRATWRVFGTAFAGSHARRFGDDLRRVAQLLGAVRDLDVLLETVGGRDDVSAMAATWRARRDAAFEELVRYLDSGAYDRFIDEFLAGTGARAYWAPGRRAHELVADGAPARLERPRERMLAAEADARGSNDAAAWHALRIAAKKMRYTLEAFREVLDERAATEFIDRLRTLQDNLGEMNDAAVAAREAAAWLMSTAGADAPPDERVGAARYIGTAEGLVANARADFATVWPAVAECAVPAVRGESPSAPSAAPEALTKR
jgi:CHAD domain-containing protein